MTDVYCNLNPLIRYVSYVPHLPDAQACVVMHTLQAGFATFKGRGIMCRLCARQPGSLWSAMVLLMHMPYHSGGEYVEGVICANVASVHSRHLPLQFTHVR